MSPSIVVHYGRVGLVNKERESCTLLYRDLTTFAALLFIAIFVSLFVKALSPLHIMSSFLFSFFYYGCIVFPIFEFSCLLALYIAHPLDAMLVDFGFYILTDFHGCSYFSDYFYTV